MLIIPLIGKISLRNPPVVTILLILVNVVVYFGLQRGDMAASMAAHQYYVQSGLMEIELPRFLAFKENRPNTDADLETLEAMNDAALGDLLGQSIRSGRFQMALDNDRVITPEDPIYVKWKPLRSEFLVHYESSIPIRWGFRPIFQHSVSPSLELCPVISGATRYKRLVGSIQYPKLIAPCQYMRNHLTLLRSGLFGGVSARTDRVSIRGTQMKYHSSG